MKKSEVKKMLLESILEDLNEDVFKEDINNDSEYNRGFQAGVKARVKGQMLDDEQLKNHYPPYFAKGYKRALYGNWWDRFNSKLTDFAGRLGYSRTRGI